MAGHLPASLQILANWSLGIAILCAILIAVDVIRRPQPMWIMNLVWPLTALFGSVLWLAAYAVWGRAPRRDAAAGPPHHGTGEGHDHHASDMHGGGVPFPVIVGKASSHCGAGCTLGDIIAEWTAFFVPAVAALFGWHWLFETKMFAIWVLDFIVAFLLGILFQYFTIRPMRQVSAGEALKEALRADIASISAWQVGMYGAMAIFQFAWLRPAYGVTAPTDSATFWFLMQLAMLCGFVTSYPANWLLLRAGVKEPM